MGDLSRKGEANGYAQSHLGLAIAGFFIGQVVILSKLTIMSINAVEENKTIVHHFYEAAWNRRKK